MGVTKTETMLGIVFVWTPKTRQTPFFIAIVVIAQRARSAAFLPIRPYGPTNSIGNVHASSRDREPNTPNHSHLRLSLQV